ncbi:MULTISPECIES: aspartate aminotransferase family protein [Rhizobium/Agrobacterium group]|uniref:Aminotransferase class III-fold pyridoxal phosphate-dependent enzyme n=3 Tax=Agrobacterium TaxID=357 RepID=A0A546XJ34_AGRTU|nr:MULTISPECIES: aminotransferase class III-fold pyridoxal phosphate-dependent enzyme [Rhizobium/Agrobacterium group]MCZ7472280.1 aminotransferase class III-fold pyridoxal phosphate-dependent enzyme [Rhizobium rhizogenes]MCZ7483307.1 aminotransferase class III-fold pyridoxal phosphate-dependent enzyme [Rhizobium rhizogenes]MCZ7501750.1 aminotransferase class III-fold pyridoxal phosphate-dependent enzyme [Rhizobium rhizogenes]MCZ7911518.1 aminotransferase class III-fold pyridoxal phosphate-depen
MSSSASAYMINGFDPSTVDKLPADEQALIARRRKLLGPSYKLFYEHPVHVVRGEGVWLYDPEGNAYLDVYNNVPSVGHCHPRVVDAIAKQSAILNTHTRYLHDSILKYSEDLLATYPCEIANVMYTCTGSEAVDLALRISRYYTGGTGVIVTANAYHGLTTAVAEISPSMGPNVPIGQHVYVVDAPDQYRSEGEDVGEVFAQRVEDAIKTMQRHGIKLAAFIADGIFSTDGILTEPAGFLKKTVDVVHTAGGLYIADEVQPGFGRTGTHWWGFQRHGIVPDLVVMGKPMGNGMPIAGVAAKPEVLERFGNDIRYFNTFGANTVSIAAAQAVLDVIKDEKLMENSAKIGEYMVGGMRKLQDKYEKIGAVRGAGLFMGMEFVTDRKSKTPNGKLSLGVVNGLREKRMLISASSSFGHVLKIRPPLPFTVENADLFLSALDEVLAELS